MRNYSNEVWEVGVHGSVSNAIERSRKTAFTFCEISKEAFQRSIKEFKVKPLPL